MSVCFCVCLAVCFLDYSCGCLIGRVNVVGGFVCVRACVSACVFMSACLIVSAFVCV